MTGAPSKPGSPLRGRYLVRNRAWNAVLRATDAVLARAVRASPATLAGPPKRILIAVGGQLGDAVIATTVLPLLARAFPNAEIGMLLPSWSRQVMDGHPRLRWIHHADHWKLSRARMTRGAKWKAYQESAARAVNEIRAVGYDLAIDLYAYYPNASWLLWRANVPTRIGYTSGGGGPLYTRAMDWTPALGHTSAQHAQLIRHATSEAASEASEANAPTSVYDLPPLPTSAFDRARAHVTGRYIVAHPGTGDLKKAWPFANWRELIHELEARGERIVMTGAGTAERDVADRLATDHARALNLVGQLDWQTFRAVMHNAAAAIGPDSVAMHVAAAEGTPAVAIMAAMSDPEHWRPLGARVAVLSHSVRCAPCFQKAGCAAMPCVRDVTVRDVLRALDELEIGEALRV